MIPDSVKDANGNTYKVTKIADNATSKVSTVNTKALYRQAAKNTTVKTIKIGNNVTTIGDSAFAGCTKLTTVTLGKNVTTLGKNTFKAIQIRIMR